MDCASEDADVASYETTVLTALVSSQPGDKCNHRLQHLDVRDRENDNEDGPKPSCLSEAQSDDGAIATCLKHMFAIVESGEIFPAVACMWPAIMTHFSERPHLLEDLLENVVSSSVCIAVQVDARMWQVVRQHWPLRLLGHKNTLLPAEERSQIRLDFYRHFFETSSRPLHDSVDDRDYAPPVGGPTAYRPPAGPPWTGLGPRGSGPAGGRAGAG